MPHATRQTLRGVSGASESPGISGDEAITLYPAGRRPRLDLLARISSFRIHPAMIVIDRACRTRASPLRASVVVLASRELQMPCSRETSLPLWRRCSASEYREFTRLLGSRPRDQTALAHGPSWASGQSPSRAAVNSAHTHGADLAAVSSVDARAEAAVAFFRGQGQAVSISRAPTDSLRLHGALLLRRVVKDGDVSRETPGTS